MSLTVEGAVAILTGFSAFILCMRYVVRSDIRDELDAKLSRLDETYLRKDAYGRRIEELEDEVWPQKGRN